MGLQDHCGVGSRGDSEVRPLLPAMLTARLDDLRKDVVQDDKKIKSEAKR